MTVDCRLPLTASKPWPGKTCLAAAPPRCDLSSVDQTDPLPGVGLTRPASRLYDGARGIYLLILRPEMPALHGQLARLVERKGDRQGALGQYCQALQLAPDNPGLQRDVEGPSRPAGGSGNRP